MTYRDLKQSYEASKEALSKIHWKMYSIAMGTLVVSLVVSQACMHILKNPVLFLQSSLFLLIFCLPILGYHLRKSRDTEEQLVEHLIKGLATEASSRFGNYFTNALNAYQRSWGFVYRGLPMWGLMGLITAWSRHILNSTSDAGSDSTMLLVSVAFSCLAVYVLAFGIQPYRKLRKHLKFNNLPT